MSCKSSHTITTARAPRGNVNTKKRKAMSKITELSTFISYVSTQELILSVSSLAKIATSASFECHTFKKLLKLAH